MRKALTDILYSFPVQLFLLHLRSNLMLLGIWLLLTLFLTGSMGKKYGIEILFLAPEYLNEVGFWSFFILGLSFGALHLSWNLTCYLLNAHHFPFLASLEKPFTKFSLNNSLLPLSFAVLLLSLHVRFEKYFMYSSFGHIAINCLGFIVGCVVFLAVFSIYFRYTNKDINSYYKLHKHLPPNLSKDLNPGNRKIKIEDIKAERTKWRVDTYLSFSLRPKLVRSVAHYDIRLLMRVFKQNHINALIIQLVSFVVLVGLGLLIEYPIFRIPAAASVFLIGSLLCALIGAITYWFTRWRITVLLLMAVTVNYITGKDYFNHKNKAYGLNYQTEKAIYTHDNLRKICSADNRKEDYQRTIRILNNWKKKNAPNGEKPKMVLYSVSGGGLKSATWAMQALQHVDKDTKGDFMQHTVLMTGASGGMIGSAYFRELYLQKLQGNDVDIYDDCHVDNISKDLLNSVSFSIATNDLFFPLTSFKSKKYTYKRDRGYIFEKQLNENVEGVFSGSMHRYAKPEQRAEIPMLFLTPAIVNDGRRIIMSPQGVSYMMAPPAALYDSIAIDIDAVDFGRLFQNQDSKNLHFLTALRANATFPYILPNIYLPTEPQVEIMDAGFRDNLGLKSAVRFIHVFKDWIKHNTSGVLLVQVAGFDRNTEITASDNQGVFTSLFNPLGIAGQVIDLQFYENDNNVGLIYDLLGKEMFDVAHLTYRPADNNFEAPISFHLSERGRNDIIDAIYQKKNQQEIKRIKKLLKRTL